MSYYSTGAVSVTGNSATVTGSGTAWTLAIANGGVFNCDGFSVPILSIGSDTSMTLLYAWPGNTGTGKTYAIDVTSAQAADTVYANYRMAEIIRRVEAGTFLDFDAVGTAAERAAYNAQPRGFVYAQVDVDPFLVSIKKSDTSGDWSTAQSLRGPAGNPGLNGTSSAWTGSEADVSPALTDRVAIKTAGGLYRMSPVKDVLPWSLVNALPDGGRFAGTPEPVTSVGAYTAPSYFTGYNGSTLAAGPKFVHNNSNNGGVTAMDTTMSDLIQAMRPGAVGSTYWRYGTEFYSMDITAGAGVSNGYSFSGTLHSPCLANQAYHIHRNYMLHYWVLPISGSMAIFTTSANREVYVDGVLNSSLAPLTSGWHRVGIYYRDLITSHTGYLSALSFLLYATPGSVIRLAAPVVAHGGAYTGQIIGTVPSARAFG